MLHQLSATSSSTDSSSVSGSGAYAVVSRLSCPAGTVNPVSDIPSGSKMRSRSTDSSAWPDARARQHAEHLGRRVVEPLLARLVHERQRPEGADPPVDVVRHGRPRWAADALEPERGLGPLDRVAAGWRHHRAEAEPEAEEVLDGDRSAGGHGVVELGVDGPQDPAVGELRHEFVDGLVEAQEARFDQRHRRRRR